MTVDEVSRLLRVSKMTTYRLVHDGKLTALRIGNSYRVPSSAFQAFLERARTAESDPHTTGSPDTA